MSDGWTTTSGLIEFSKDTPEKEKNLIQKYFIKQGFVAGFQDNGTLSLEADFSFDRDTIRAYMKRHKEFLVDFFLDETDHLPGQNYLTIDGL